MSSVSSCLPRACICKANVVPSLWVISLILKRFFMGLLFSQTSEFQLQPPSSIQQPLSVCYSTSNSFSLPSGPLYQLHPSSLSVEEKKQIPGGETATLPLSYPAERTKPFLTSLGPSSSPSSAGSCIAAPGARIPTVHWCSPHAPESSTAMCAWLCATPKGQHRHQR